MAEGVNEDRAARGEAELPAGQEAGGDPSAAGAGAAEAGSGAVVTGSSMLDLDYVRGLIEAVDRSGIDSLEISRGGTRIRVSKSPPAPAYVPPPVIPPALAAAPAVAGAAPAAPAPAAESPPSQPATPQKELFEVRSPMVGTFYRAPAPEAPPYVEPGSLVSKGQTLCILEAMKLMNELQSEIDGVVREILVENAEPVEYGQVLFLIEPIG